MAEVTWVKGTIDPPQSGEYYVTLEADSRFAGDGKIERRMGYENE